MKIHDWKKLDSQLRTLGPFFQDELGIAVHDYNCLASLISQELRELPLPDLMTLCEDDKVPIQDRVDELIAFQSFMDFVSTVPRQHPGLVRAQVITQNYICFVYLNDALFKTLKRRMPCGTITKKCARFLIDNPVRAFRNAISHSNWRYLPDFSGLEFWSRKGEDQTSEFTYFKVLQKELNFWQMLARSVAYITYIEIINRAE